MATIERRSTQDGSISFRVKVRLKGRPAQHATFERRTDAARWAQRVESDIREGRHFSRAEAKKHTVADLVDRYCTTVLSKKSKIADNQLRQLNWWKREIGSFRLSDVTSALVGEKRDVLLAGKTAKGTARAPATAVRYLAALSHAFSVAVKEWGWIEANPVSKVNKPKEPRGRVRFLSDDERSRLLEVCRASRNPQLLLAVVMAISTGMRKSEIMSLSWAVVDLPRGRLILHETKNGERRSIPIASYALQLLTEASKVRRLGTNLVFPGQNPQKPIDLRSAWETALATAQIEDFRFHDLRHCCASYLAMNGASLAEIAEVLGHKTLAMVKRYAHLSEGHTTKVVARMNNAIFNA